MDTLRGNFDSTADNGTDESFDDDSVRDGPPAAIGTDERRMHVRAYNHWAGLLADRNFPAIEDLDTDSLPDFGPYSVLLDFTAGIENPGITFLGSKLAQECGATTEVFETLSDVPSRSLLSRITDHYMQILANQAPIGFEAEFVNQRSQTILYRGILLPFSSDDDTIDFIYGVISWKELADQHAADELLLEIDQALEVKPPRAPLLEPVETLTDWADGPGSLAADDLASSGTAYLGDDGLPRPSFGLTDDTAFEVGTDVPLGNATTMTPDNDFDAEEDEDTVEPQGASLTDYAPLFSDPLVPGLLKKKPIQLDGPAGFAEPFETADSGDFADPIELQEFAESLNPADMALGDWLAAAREMAIAARTSEDRTRNALYDAIGRAYDFSLAACDEPEEFEDLLADSGLTMQERAPMTPVVKLVFGADYDKTRLTEYAAALSFAFRSNLPRGSLGDYLAQYDGGLKGVVKAERRLRREDSGKPVEEIDAPRRALAKKLRALPPQDFAAIETEGSEFALVMIRRTATGVVEFLGEVPDDVALVERAARRLIG